MRRDAPGGSEVVGLRVHPVVRDGRCCHGVEKKVGRDGSVRV